MKRLLPAIASAALAAACAAPEYTDDESVETGKSDDLREDGSTFFVYANGRLCVTTPCPVYTAITPGAVRFDVSEVNLARVGREVDEQIQNGGMLVRGQLDVGSWEPGGEGTLLAVEQGLAPAEQFFVWRGAASQEMEFAALTMTGETIQTHNLDLEGLRSGGKREPTLAGLVAGDWATKGFIGRSDTGVVTLFATAVAGWSWPCTVFASGIECVTAPCPSWSMIDPEGVSLGNAASIEMGYMRLSPEREAQLRLHIATGAVDVYGWVLEGDWSPHQRGDVLFVLGLDDDDDQPW